MADLLYRTLKYDGYKPKWVMNITDIDDKTIKGAITKFGNKATVENLREFTQFYLDEFLKDLSEVNVVSSEDYQIYQPGQALDFSKKLIFIRVTDVIKETQDFIVELINKGYAYKADDGSTYFSIEKYQKGFDDYGALVGEKFIEGKKVGARVAVDEYEKDNLSDFALWKAWDEASDAQIFWDHSTLGKGRPGWHIECSVINKIGFNGEPTDIHTGGVDLIFPHHTNEIAQSQALFGKGNFVHHWFHSEHLLVDGKKMSKSAGNFYVLKDLKPINSYHLDKYQPYALRYLFLQAHYRVQQNFTQKSLDASHNGLLGLIVSAHKDGVISDLRLVGLDNDLNSPLAISENKPSEILEALIGISVKSMIDPNRLVSDDELSADIKSLKKERETAKNQKDFKKSDELRKQIEDLGYEVMDTPEGQKVKKKLQI